VSDRGLAKPQVEAFVEFHLQEGAELVRSVGYIPLQSDQYAEELAKVRHLAAGAAAATSGEAPADEAPAGEAPAGEDTTAAQ
jgi:hypothetical protein